MADESPRFDETTANGFLTAVFGELEGHGHIVIWTPASGEHPGFYSDVGNATRRAQQLTARGCDVYFGVGYTAGRLRHGRGKKTDIQGICCLWADVDVAGEGHQGKAYPPTFDDARAVLGRLPLKPSIVVHSGHGLQAFWLLNEPWEFRTQTERDAAQRLALRWTETVMCAARDAGGWDIDAVGDITRVMRVPGTVNRKAEPVPVRLLEPGDAEWLDVVARYNPDDFDVHAVSRGAMARKPAASEKSRHTAAVAASEAAEPPSAKLTALLANDKAFNRTWNRDRSDLKDQSPSAYELSLACKAVQAEWTDQEIANLIIAWGRTNRRSDEHPDKVYRRDYLERTIRTAREGMTEGVDEDEIQARGRGEEPGPEDGTAQRREYIQGRLGIPLHKILKYGRHDSRYALVMEDGRDIPIGTVETLLTYSKFRRKIYDATLTLIPPMNAKAWTKMVGHFKHIIVEDVAEEDNSALEAQRWVSDYLDHRHTRPEKDLRAIANRDPFVDGGMIYVHGDDLQDWLRSARSLQLGARGLGSRLKWAGFRRTTVAYRTGSSTSSRSYWCIPMDDFQVVGSTIEELKEEDSD